MKQLLRYGLVGVANTAVGYVVIFACMYLVGLGPVPSNVAGYAVGLIMSYALNRVYTFRSTGAKRGELARFILIFFLSYVANLGALILMTRVFGLDSGLSQLLAGAVYSGLSYVLNKVYVFRQTESIESVGER